jgi:Mycoplasma protein of unknown function, DUF285
LSNGTLGEKVPNLEYIFNFSTSFNENISSCDLGRVQSMNLMVRIRRRMRNETRPLAIGRVDSNLPLTYHLSFIQFADATSFNQDLSRWNVSRLVEANSMFLGAESFQQNLCAWENFLLTRQSSTCLPIPAAPSRWISFPMGRSLTVAPRVLRNRPD